MKTGGKTLKYKYGRIFAIRKPTIHLKQRTAEQTIADKIIGIITTNEFVNNKR